jgi:hypothetical protein
VVNMDIRFAARPYRLANTTLLRLPKTASEKLPSRGQVAVQGTLNGAAFQTVVEPDGSFGHWIRLDETLRRKAGIKLGDPATLVIEPVRAWPEPVVPRDLWAALAAAPLKVRAMWEDITPMARWEWVRWVDATNNVETRKRRVEVTISKMKSGKRRPCCFNLAGCTDPNLSRNGRLIDSAGDR